MRILLVGIGCGLGIGFARAMLEAAGPIVIPCLIEPDEFDGTIAEGMHYTGLITTFSANSSEEIRPAHKARSSPPSVPKCTPPTGSRRPDNSRT